MAAETTGDALNAAKFASASDVQIVVVPFVITVGAEALVTEVDVPTHLRNGEQFDLNVSIQANQSMRAIVRVLARNEILYEGTHELHKGSQTLRPAAYGTGIRLRQLSSANHTG